MSAALHCGAERRRALEELARRRARADLGIFGAMLWTAVPKNTQLTWSKSLTVLSLAVQQVLIGAKDVLVLNCPPGIGKSSFGSRFSLPWAWLMHRDDINGLPYGGCGPWLNWAGGAHTLETLAAELNTDRRKIIEHPLYRALIPTLEDGSPSWEPSPTKWNAIAFENQAVDPMQVRAGGFSATCAPQGGRGAGPIDTGAHPHIQSHDDLLKAGDPLATAMPAVNRWLTDTMSTRFPCDRPRIIAIGQRLGDGDYSAALLSEYPSAVHIEMPMVLDDEAQARVRSVSLGTPHPLLAEAFDGEPSLANYRRRHEAAGISIEGGQVTWRDWRRQLGELLVPERFGPDFIAKQARRRVFFATQYQQRPQVDGGNIINRDWWQTWQHLPAGEPDEVMISMDPQTGSADRIAPDWTVVYVLARYGARVFFLEELRGQFNFTDTARALFLLAERWPSATRKLIEDDGCGPAVVELLQMRVNGLALEKPKSRTAVRVERVQPLIEAGDVWLPAADAERPARLLADDEAWGLPVTFCASDRRLPQHLREARPRLITTIAPSTDWPDPFRDEWSACPRGAHDDRCSAGAQALLRWLRIHASIRANADAPLRPTAVRPVTSLARRAGFPTPGRASARPRKM